MNCKYRKLYQVLPGGRWWRWLSLDWCSGSPSAPPARSHSHRAEPDPTTAAGHISVWKLPAQVNTINRSQRLQYNIHHLSNLSSLLSFNSFHLSEVISSFYNLLFLWFITLLLSKTHMLCHFKSVSFHLSLLISCFKSQFLVLYSLAAALSSLYYCINNTKRKNYAPTSLNLINFLMIFFVVILCFITTEAHSHHLKQLKL